MNKKLDRRNFLLQSAKAGLGLSLGGFAYDSFSAEMLPILGSYPFEGEPLETVRIGMVGVGGMDYFEDYRLINALKNGIEPDMDVYDAVMMSAVVELSGKSIKQGSMPIKFPDFTRGMWKIKRALKVMEM